MKKYYYSENGCVKIGNEENTILLLNGKGEGSFWIYIYDNQTKIPNTSKFIALINGGGYKIYESENSNSDIYTLKSGKYMVFSNKGDIIFIKKQ